MGEIGLDYVRVRQDNGRDQHGFADWRERLISLWSFTVEEQQERRRSACGS